MNVRDLPSRVDQTIESVAELERTALADASLHQRAIERATLLVGRPRTLYLVGSLIAVWIVVNVALDLAKAPVLDAPPFFWLGTVTSTGGVLVALMVLTAANRADRLDEQRDRLHLQIALLTERKTAKVIELLEELRRDMPDVPNRRDHEASEMTLPTDPHAIASELERRTPRRGDPATPEV